MTKKPIFKKVGASFELVDKPAASEVEVEKQEPKVECECEETHKLLQRQVNHEFENERLYLSMALWCEEKGFVETAKFFSGHALEERAHGMDFINFMAMKKMKVLTPVPTETKREYENLREVLEDSVKREKETSKMIGELLKVSINDGNLASVIAKKYMGEQLEEEQLFNSILNLHELCNGSKIDFEMEIGNIKANGKYKLGSL
jgi:ferritin